MPDTLLALCSRPAIGDDELRVLRAIADSPAFELIVVELPGASPEAGLSMLESIYRRVDRALFRRPRPAGPAIVVETDLARTVAARAPTAIIDLTGSAALTTETFGIPVLRLTIENLPAARLTSAVRRRIGVSQACARVKAIEITAGGERLLYLGACWLDHRSLSRSVDLVARKVPMLLKGALSRRAGSPLPNPANPDADFGIEAGSSVPALVWQLVGSIANRMFRRVRWKIVVYANQPENGLETPWVELDPGPGSFWADPFIVPHAGGLAVFFEELVYRENRGKISVVHIDESGRRGDARTVLDKPWHLSYPFMRREGGKLFMLPESSAHGTLDVYECIDFPYRWEFVKTIVSGVRLADASIVDWQGKLWMFAAHGEHGASNYDELNIYWAASLMGPWTPHALNPVKIDAGSARPAGSMFIDNGRIVRPTQDCRNRYGDKVSLQEILVLDEARFEERSIGGISPGRVSPEDAVHTYNEAAGFAVIDAAGWISRI